jgi:uncharacterized protein YecT (DUF1311 family)
MQKITLFFLAVIFYSSFCLAQTQTEMNQDAGKSYKQVDKKLNDVYQKIFKLYSKNTLFLKNLRTSQKIWIQFRDAQLAMKYPERSPGYYGSILPICKESYLSELTSKRVKELEVWLGKPIEGDDCTGTVGEYVVEE